MPNDVTGDAQLKIDGVETGPQVDFQHVRIVEAVLFASADPISERVIATRLPEGTNISDVLTVLQDTYASRGVNLNRVGDKWAFRTAVDLAGDLHIEVEKAKKMTRATLETLAIIAYHEPVTRSEVEEIRGDLPGLADLKAAGLLDSRPGMGRYGANSDDEALPDLVDDGEVTDSVVEEALTTRNLEELDETIYSDNPNLLDHKEVSET